MTYEAISWRLLETELLCAISNKSWTHFWAFSTAFLSQDIQKWSVLRQIPPSKLDWNWPTFQKLVGELRWINSTWMPKLCSFRYKKNQLIVFTSGIVNQASRSKDITRGSDVLVNLGQVGLNVASSNPFEMYLEQNWLVIR